MPSVTKLIPTCLTDARLKSERSLRKAILLDPKNVSPYVGFALISAAHQSNQVGINLVTDGITQNPNAPQLYLARGVLYAQLESV